MQKKGMFFGFQDSKKRLFHRHISEEQVIAIAFSICLSFVFYGFYLHDHYSLDAYGMINATEWPFFQMMSHGRPFMDIVMHFLFSIGINPVKYQAMFAILLMLTIAFSIYTVYFEVLAGLKKTPSLFTKIILFGSCCVGFLNFCFQEWFNFSDGMVQFIGGLLFAVLSLRSLSKGKYIRTFILMYVALGFYQAVLGIFITWGLLIIFLQYAIKDKEVKALLKSTVRMLIIAGGASVSNILTTKVAQLLNLVGTILRSVQLSPKLLIENIKRILETQEILFFGGYYHMPQYFLFIILILSVVCLLTLLILAKRFKEIPVFILMILVAYSSSYLPFIFSESFWMPPRTIIAILSSFSVVLILNIAVLTEFEDNFSVFMAAEILCSGLVMVLLVVNLVHVQKETIDLFTTNELDYYISQQIGYEIDQYEAETGNVVDTIQWHTDTNYVGSYPHVTTNAFDTNSRAFNVVWSWYGLFAYTLNREFIIEDMSEEDYQRLFGGKNWEYFLPDEELAFEDNVMYIILN